MTIRIAVAGAGPAGTSLAIRLAQQGFHVTLIERETFPRHKLCGEFISPECLAHFEELGVLNEMLAAGGDRITETRFYEPTGRSFAVSSGSFRGKGFALSLSRSQMDLTLLDRARSVGVLICDGSKVTSAWVKNGAMTRVTYRCASGENVELPADLFVDATGRSQALSKLASKAMGGRLRKSASGSLYVGFKAHMLGADIEKGLCEIYLFPGGYGGLSNVEIGLTNYCFLVTSKVARGFDGDAVKLMQNVGFRNKRAAKALANAKPVADWLAVSIENFGPAPRNEISNLFSIGDSAAFVDPFTGSGMLMAFESSALLAKAVQIDPSSAAQITYTFDTAYKQAFARRLLVCSVLRRASFIPFLPAAVISLLNLSKRSREYLAEATRSTDRGVKKIID